MAASIFVSSMFNVSGRMSTKTGVAPRSTNAFAVETNVNDGMMTSSPAPTPLRMAAISRAAVQECVRSAFWLPTRCSSQAQHRLENSPFPARWPFAWACEMYQSSRPVMYGLLKGITADPPTFDPLSGHEQERSPGREGQPAADQGPLDLHHGLQHHVHGPRLPQFVHRVDRPVGPVAAQAQSRSEHHRQEERDEGGHPNDLEPGRLDLAAKLRRGVAASVTGLLILWAPEPRMLWDRDDEASARAQGLADLSDDRFVIIDVLKDVEGADRIEHTAKWDVPCVHLGELGRWDPLRGECQTCAEDLASRELDRRIGRADPAQDEPRAAPDLEEVPATWKVHTHRPDDQGVASPKPPVVRLQLGQFTKVLLAEALVLQRQAWRERVEATDDDGLAAAVGTRPGVVTTRRAADTADLHAPVTTGGP